MPAVILFIHSRELMNMEKNKSFLISTPKFCLIMNIASFPKFTIVFILISILFTSCSFKLNGRYYSELTFDGKHVGTSYFDFDFKSKKYSWRGTGLIEKHSSGNFTYINENTIVLKSETDIFNLPLIVSSYKSNLNLDSIRINLFTITERTDSDYFKVYFVFDDSIRIKVEDFKNSSIMVSDSVKKVQIFAFDSSNTAKVYRFNSNFKSEYLHMDKDSFNEFNIYFELPVKYSRQMNLNKDSITIINRREIYSNKFGLHFIKKKPR